MKYLATFVLIFTIQINAFAESPPEKTVTELNAKNTKLQFEIDSTWHTVHGVAKKLFGTIYQQSSPNQTNLSGTVIISTKDLDTDNSLRDEKMRECLESERYPEIIFEVTGTSKLCPLTYGKENKGRSSSCTLSGVVSIKNVKKKIELLVTSNTDGDLSIIKAQTSLSWRDFGVTDPSILVAKVDENVKISIEIIL